MNMTVQNATGKRPIAALKLPDVTPCLITTAPPEPRIVPRRPCMLMRAISAGFRRAR